MDAKLAGAEKMAFAKSAKGFYSGNGKSETGGKKKGSFAAKSAGVALVAGLVIALIGVVILTPMFLVGTIKENLMSALGFNDTVAILEKQAEYVTSENLAKGKMPKGYSSDLAASGIEVGQVTLGGKFVRTDNYIANIEELDLVAAEGEYYVHGGDGELVMKFGDEIITANNFVAKVESSPKLYAAYSEALDISARFYYSDAVNNVYQDMGISRGSFNGWQNSADAKNDDQRFKEALSTTLDRESSRTISGEYIYWNWECVAWDDDGNCTDEDWVEDEATWSCTGGGSSWSCNKTIYCPHSGSTNTESKNISGDSESVASGIVSYVAANSRKDNVTGNSAEANAIQMLNTVLSADEPYRAASDFMALMESIERAQVDGDGPVNEMMNLISEPHEITYMDYNTQTLVTDNLSILETDNFKTAIGQMGQFSKEDANNISRDRILKATGSTSKNSIENMPLSTSGKNASGDGLKMNNTTKADNSPANLGNVASIVNAIKIGLADKNSDVFPTSLGANRILEGGSFISNTINQQVIGAMPSDAAQVASYKQEVNEVLARKAEADRATKSPFDISSPYTFMGSLMRKVAVSYLGNYAASRGNSFGTIAGTIATLAGDSIKGLTGNATADGNENAFTSMIGDCVVVPTTGATCDLYGSSHNTVYTGYMNYREEDWARIIDETKAEKFASEAMKRDATVGIESFDVCSRAKDTGSSSSGVIGKIKGFFDKVVSVIKSIVRVVTGAAELDSGCSDVEKDVATGSKYVLHGGVTDDTAKLSGYALYSTVSSLLEDKEDTTASR